MNEELLKALKAAVHDLRYLATLAISQEVRCSVQVHIDAACAAIDRVEGG